MIEELVAYYDRLLRDNVEGIPPYGWCIKQVAYIARISPQGELIVIIPLSDRSSVGKMVPTPANHSNTIAAHFLCDNAKYVFGITEKAGFERAKKCFKSSCELYSNILAEVNTPCATALKRFFATWDPDMANECSAVACEKDELVKRGNIVFEVDDDTGLLDPLEDDEIRRAWESYLVKREHEQLNRCLATGELAPIARLHPFIKGVEGTRPEGAPLVSFNGEAFESYGHEKGWNAPVSERAAHAYTTALNYLLSTREHRARLGDTTVVYWSEHSDHENCSLMSLFLGGWSPTNATYDDADVILDATIKAMGRGEWRSLEGIDPETRFYILGLAPCSKARLSVRYFYHSSFGNMLEHLARHYCRLEVTRQRLERKYVTPYYLLREVEPPKVKKPVVAPILNGPLLKAMLEDTPYPQALYDKCLLRIWATQENADKHVYKVTRERAAIIRAYLIRNYSGAGYDERGLSVELNENRNETAYALGRAFAVLERIQDGANQRITITNQYFNAASTTPATVYPQLLRLSVAHLSKMRRGDKVPLANYWEKTLCEIMGDEKVHSLPARLTKPQQGDFMLGYYHQKRWKPDDKEKVDSNGQKE